MFLETISRLFTHFIFHISDHHANNLKLLNVVKLSYWIFKFQPSLKLHEVNLHLTSKSFFTTNKFQYSTFFINTSQLYRNSFVETYRCFNIFYNSFLQKIKGLFGYSIVDGLLLNANYFSRCT